MEDQGIIHLYLQRSQQAISETKNKYGAYCRAIARNILSNLADVEECENDAYLAAWNAIPPHRSRKLSVFLGRLTRNIALDRHGYNTAKKRNREFDVILTELEGCLAAPDTVETTDYYKNQNTEPYIRYLTPNDMELAPAASYDAEKFIQALKSDNNESVYIAINRLVESFNDGMLREKALKELQPFEASNNPKITDAAAFAIDILSQSYRSPYVYKLADGSILFTLFNHYSDYGSHNVLWRIKDNVLEEYFSFSSPSMYIKEVIPSSGRKLIAVVTCSNKSEFVQILNVEEGRVSPELVESARVNYGAQKGLDTWIRTDHENYSYANRIEWTDEDTLQFEGSLAYQDTEIIENVTVTYRYSEKRIEVRELDESR